MAASCVRQHWVWRQSGPGTQTVKSATMRSEHRQDLKTLACMDLPCGPCTAPAAMPAASRLLARQPTILHDPSRPPGRRVVFKRGAQARSMARLRTPHVVALAVAGALLLGVRPSGGELPPPPLCRLRPLTSCRTPAVLQPLLFPPLFYTRRPARSLPWSAADAGQLVRLGLDGGAHGAAAAAPGACRHAQCHRRLRPGVLRLMALQGRLADKHLQCCIAYVAPAYPSNSHPSARALPPLLTCPPPPASGSFPAAVAPGGRVP